MTKHEHTIKLFILDNECSNDLGLATLKTYSKVKLILLHQYRRNADVRDVGRQTIW